MWSEEIPLETELDKALKLLPQYLVFLITWQLSISEYAKLW